MDQSQIMNMFVLSLGISQELRFKAIRLSHTSIHDHVHSYGHMLPQWQVMFCVRLMGWKVCLPGSRRDLGGMGLLFGSVFPLNDWILPKQHKNNLYLFAETINLYTWSSFNRS